MAYVRLQRKRWRRLRGFRLNSVRLRKRVFAVFSRWLRGVMERVQYRGSAGAVADCECYRGSGAGSESRRHLVSDAGRNVGVRSSWGRSNSFCAEAISDCLEFIRRNSVGADRVGCSDVGR